VEVEELPEAPQIDPEALLREAEEAAGDEEVVRCGPD
jgi:hypothetical protein